MRWLVVANVEHTVRRVAGGGVRVGRVKLWVGFSRFVDDADDAFHDVVNVGEVAHHLAVVEHVNRLAFQDGFGEQKQRHVRSAPRAIDREETQPCCRQSKQVAVGMRHQLVGLFSGRIQADRVVDIVMLAEGQLGVATIHTGTAGISQVLDAVVPARFQDVGEALHVGINIGVRVGKRIAHPGLGRQVDDALGLFSGKQVGHALAVSHVQLMEGEVRVAAEVRQARFFQSDVVIVVQVVNAHHLVAPRQQAQAGVHANKTGRAGDEVGDVQRFKVQGANS